MNREIKFSLILKKHETGELLDIRYDYADIFNGIAKLHLETTYCQYYVIATRQYTGLLISARRSKVC